MKNQKFNYSLDFKQIDFRQQPELYQIGVGEQGVLLIEPYKSEILPHWRFRSPEIAQASAEKIYNMFLAYIAENDFVGADMARKFLQMGYTRARRYANHKSGKKYSRNPQNEIDLNAERNARKKYLLPNEDDPLKAQSAAIFKTFWELAKNNEEYKKLKEKHKELYDH